MSVYNSNESNTFKESAETRLARFKVRVMCKYLFKEKGLKLIKIVEEVPFTFPTIKYHADFGILLTTYDYETQYFFFIEIDGRVGHGTKISDKKDEDRDWVIERKTGAITIRLQLSELQELKTITQSMGYIREKIWDWFSFVYLEDSGGNARMDDNQKKNKKFAEIIANNAFPMCDCKHPNYQHDLGGCDWQYSVNDKLKCHCDRQFLRSDK